MAMRIFSKGEFEAILVSDYGCRMVEANTGFDLWENHDSKAFMVPHPEETENNGYPDFILDDLVSQGKLVPGTGVAPLQVVAVNSKK